jgi:hypothetical protein
METLFIIGFLLIGLLTLLGLLFSSSNFNNLHATNQKSPERFFDKIKQNTARIKQLQVFR